MQNPCCLSFIHFNLFGYRLIHEYLSLSSSHRKSCSLLFIAKALLGVVSRFALAFVQLMEVRQLKIKIGASVWEHDLELS